MPTGSLLADLRAQAARYGWPLWRLAVRRVTAHLGPVAALRLLAALIVAALAPRRLP